MPAWQTLQHRSWGLGASIGSLVFQDKQQPVRYTKGESVLNPLAKISRENMGQTVFCPPCNLQFSQAGKKSELVLTLGSSHRNQLRGDISGRNQKKVYIKYGFPAENKKQLRRVVQRLLTMSPCSFLGLHMP